jgi:hypothetical protein
MALFRRKAGGPEGWFYCLRHRTVEEGLHCPAKDRLGPYATRAEAEHAVETARQRDEEWRADPRWRDDPDEDGDPGGP